MDDRPADAETEIVETAPAATDKETGVALDGDYPHNHRLRAEAMARDELAEDPDGLISPELIADATRRLEAEARAAELRAEEERKARPPVSESMKVAELEEIAGREGADLTGATNNAQRVERIEAHRAASSNPVPPPGEPEKPAGDGVTGNEGEEG